MFDNDAINLKLATVAELFHAKLGIRASTLGDGLRKAGRRLPPHIRRAGQNVVEAEALSEHPKLSRLQNGTAILSALDEIAAHLNTLDPKARRIDATLNLLGGMAFKLLVIAAAVVAFLIWRGYV